MSKSRILLGTLMCLVIAAMSAGAIKGVVTLKEENRKLQVENTKIQRDNNSLRTEVKNLNKVILKNNEDLKLLNVKMKQQLDINSKLQNDYNKMKQERDKALSLSKAKAKTKTVSLSKTKAPSGKQIYVRATAYTAFCDTGCTGITATGIDVRHNPDAKIVSVDPNIIPLGSKVYIEGYGYAIAGDTGGAIKGYRVDLLVRDNKTADNWGNRVVKLTILK